ncbi:MAG TPA: hypothetical protein VF985_04540 [Mariniflexile sp.]
MFYLIKMKWFKLFRLKRKSGIFCPIEAFLELHSIATERKKDVEWAKKGDFLANWKKFKPLQ